MFKTVKYEEAINCLDKAIELDASYANAYIYKGIVLNMLKKYNESLSYFDRSIALDSKNPKFHNNKGITFKRKFQIKFNILKKISRLSFK